MNRRASRWFLLLLSLVSGGAESFAASTDFSGRWFIDFRTPEERKRNAECGNAEFILAQTGDRIAGDHRLATADCGRLNEGGDDTVKGYVIGSTAVLLVTSGRNGAMVLGKATRRGEKLHWIYLEEVKPGEPPTDSGLILNTSVLTLQK